MADTWRLAAPTRQSGSGTRPRGRNAEHSRGTTPESMAGREFLTLKGHSGLVLGVTFSPDGKRLASGGQDQTVKIWDTTTGQMALSLPGHTNMVWSVAFSPDGKHLASGSVDRTAKIWRTATGP